MPIIAKQEPADNPSGALILYQNLLTSNPFVNGAKALTPNTFERWVQIATFTTTFQTGVPVEMDTICIAAHNIASENASVTVSTRPVEGSGSFTDRGSVAPTDNRALMFSFDKTTVSEVRVTVTDSINGEIGVVYAGIALQMPRNIYGGHSPITLSQKTEYRAVQSESGQILGKDIIRKGLETTFNWQLLDDQFYRDEFQTFVQSARRLPFFIKPRPDFYSDEVAYGEVNQDIQPVNMGGGHRLMSVGFTMTGHADL